MLNLRVLTFDAEAAGSLGIKPKVMLDMLNRTFLWASMRERLFSARSHLARFVAVSSAKQDSFCGRAHTFEESKMLGCAETAEDARFWRELAAAGELAVATLDTSAISVCAQAEAGPSSKASRLFQRVYRHFPGIATGAVANSSSSDRLASACVAVLGCVTLSNLVATQWALDVSTAKDSPFGLVSAIAHASDAATPSPGVWASLLAASKGPLLAYCLWVSQCRGPTSILGCSTQEIQGIAAVFFQSHDVVTRSSLDGFAWQILASSLAAMHSLCSSACSANPALPRLSRLQPLPSPFGALGGLDAAQDAPDGSLVRSGTAIGAAIDACETAISLVPSAPLDQPHFLAAEPHADTHLRTPATPAPGASNAVSTPHDSSAAGSISTLAALSGRAAGASRTGLTLHALSRAPLLLLADSPPASGPSTPEIPNCSNDRRDGGLSASAEAHSPKRHRLTEDTRAASAPHSSAAAAAAPSLLRIASGACRPRRPLPSMPPGTPSAAPRLAAAGLLSRGSPEPGVWVARGGAGLAVAVAALAPAGDSGGGVGAGAEAAGHVTPDGSPLRPAGRLGTAPAPSPPAPEHTKRPHPAASAVLAGLDRRRSIALARARAALQSHTGRAAAAAAGADGSGGGLRGTKLDTEAGSQVDAWGAVTQQRAAWKALRPCAVAAPVALRDLPAAVLRALIEAEPPAGGIAAGTAQEGRQGEAGGDDGCGSGEVQQGGGSKESDQAECAPAASTPRKTALGRLRATRSLPKALESAAAFPQLLCRFNGAVRAIAPAALAGLDHVALEAEDRRSLRRPEGVRAEWGAAQARLVLAVPLRVGGDPPGEGGALARGCAAGGADAESAAAAAAGGGSGRRGHGPCVSLLRFRPAQLPASCVVPLPCATGARERYSRSRRPAARPQRSLPVPPPPPAKPLPPYAAAEASLAACASSSAAGPVPLDPSRARRAAPAARLLPRPAPPPVPAWPVPAFVSAPAPAPLPGPTVGLHPAAALAAQPLAPHRHASLPPPAADPSPPGSSGPAHALEPRPVPAAAFWPRRPKAGSPDGRGSARVAGPAAAPSPSPAARAPGGAPSLAGLSIGLEAFGGGGRAEPDAAAPSRWAAAAPTWVMAAAAEASRLWAAQSVERRLTSLTSGRPAAPGAGSTRVRIAGAASRGHAVTLAGLVPPPARPKPCPLPVQQPVAAVCAPEYGCVLANSAAANQPQPRTRGHRAIKMAARREEGDGEA